MNKRIIFTLNTLGWLMLFFALLMGCIRFTADRPGLYHRLQTEAQILDYAGISDEDLQRLDKKLAEYLFGRIDTPNAQIPVFGANQPAFNEKELIHLADCRRLLAPTANLPLNLFLAVAGLGLAMTGKQGKRAASASLASALVLAPIALLAVWALVDFNSAFHFFHKILFTNDLWLLDPRTDLLIRICPASMFANMGARIGVMCAVVLLGIPLLLSLVRYLSERKRKQT